MDISYQRRAIFTGMRPFLKDTDLLAALEIWQNKYANKPKTPFTQFLSESCTTKELRGKRSAILSSIFNSFTLPEHDLLPDPFNQQTGQFEFTFIQKENLIDTNLVFSTFLTTLLDQLDADGETKVREYLIAHSDKKFNLNLQQLLALKMWLNKASNAFEIAFSDHDKREMVNLAYIALCQHVGPVKADQLLALSIKQTEPFAKTHQVNLHDFL